MEQKHDLSLMTLTRNDVIFIFIYYLLILILASTLVFWQIIFSYSSSDITIVENMIALSSSAACGSTIYYSRKLYKASINGDYKFVADDGTGVARVGTIAFFVLRPMFGIILSLISYCLWKASINVAVANPSEKSNFIYIVTLIGFFSGFSVGRLIEQFQEKNVDSITSSEHAR